MSKFNAGKASLFALTAAFAVAAFLLGKSVTTTLATPEPKVFICKYVGTPGDFETLQTGQNPLSVSSNTLPNGWQVGSDFSDGQGHSLVMAIDIGQDDPVCQVTPPTPVNGACGEILNTCTAGTLNNIDDSEKQYLWECTGQNGGTTASCSQEKPEEPVLGCTDPRANNYDATATEDDESCTYDSHDYCLRGQTVSIPDNETAPEGATEGACQPTPPPSNGDVCLNIDGIQTSVPEGQHLGADGTSCVNFSEPGVPTPPPAGQVLGASTMAAAGTFDEALYLAIMSLGATLSAIGSKKVFKKA